MARAEEEQVLAGLDYLIALGQRREGEEAAPYWEASLSTKDGLKIGFYHAEAGKQAAYVDHSKETTFFALKDLTVLKELFAELAKQLDEHQPTATEEP